MGEAEYLLLTLTGGGGMYKHALAVASEFEVGTDIYIVALFHDCVEDGVIGLDMLARLILLPNTKEAIDAITRRDNELYFDHIRRCKQNEMAASVKLVDLHINALRCLDHKLRNMSLHKRYVKAINILSER